MSNTYNILSLFCLLAVMFCTTTRSNAVIPTYVGTNLTLNAIDYCNGNCTIVPGATLTLTGNHDYYFNGTLNIQGRLVVQGNAVVTCANLVTVAARGLMQVDNSTIRMRPGTAIKLQGSMEPGNFTTFIGASLIANYSTFTGMLVTDFWEGIATMRGAVSSPYIYYDRYKEALVQMDHCLIERARNAITNYNYLDNPYYPTQTSGGNLDIRYSTFHNNIRSLRLNNDHHANGETGVGYNPNSPDGLNWSILFQYDDFVIDAGFSPQTLYAPVENPTEMVSATNCNSLSFLSCRFLSSNNPYGWNMTGIIGYNSGLKVQRYFYNPSGQRGEFKGLGTGIALYNNLEVNRVPVILNCDFDCQNDLSLFSCFNAWVVNNNFLKTFADNKYPSTSINLYRSTGYKVEGNTISQPATTVTAFAAGIVVNGSGTAYNEIYRNKFLPPANPNNGLAIGIQSIGRNRDNLASSGLKILCNDVNSNFYKGKDISVVRDNIPMPPNTQGVHRIQYVQGTLSSSAGNTFDNTLNAGNTVHNYYVNPNTNTMVGLLPFKYGYSFPQQAVEKPWNTNCNSSTFVNTNPKNCGIKVNAAMPPPPYPFKDFQVRLAVIEKELHRLQQQPNPWTDADQNDWETGLIDESALIDSIVDYYQFYNQTDSIALVYEQPTVGYQYRLYLASAYKDLGRFDDAIAVLSKLGTQYALDELSAQEAERLVPLYTVLQWLSLNDQDWAHMPQYLKDPVYDYEYDPTSAGGVALSILAAFEGRRYDPYYIETEEDSAPMLARVQQPGTFGLYPNPAGKTLQLQWPTAATLLLTDAAGYTVYTAAISAGCNTFDVSALKPGLYFGLIRENNHTVHQQKILKL